MKYDKVRTECQIGQCKGRSVLIIGFFKATNYLTRRINLVSKIIIFTKYNI